MTRRHVTVALSGDGGDELFAGYERYRAVQFTRWIDRLPRFVRRGMAAKVWQGLPGSVEQKSTIRRAKRFLSAVDQSPERRYLTWVSIFDERRRGELYAPEFRKRLGKADAAHPLLEAYRECPDRDFITRTTCADVLTYLPGDILTKVDIATMAHSLEARCPFLDQRVVEFAASLPIEWKLRQGRGKRILIDTFSDLLPKAIQTRPKMGFGVPLDHWFRGELKPWLREILLDPSTLGRGLFDPQAVQMLVDEHIQGRWDHSYRLWSLLVLELWQREWL
jgi:asparagine synthase (glutamine-hydrolysing)